jgi:histidine triad (HIT) family protein
MQNDCIFCRIVSGDAPSHRVFEDDEVLVFMDIQPVAEGHTLIIPRRHYENLFEASEDAMAAVARVSVRIARAIRAAFEPDGVFVAQTNGVAAGQTVFHYHLHLIPRWHGGALQLHGRKTADPSDLAQHATRIAEALRGEI